MAILDKSKSQVNIGEDEEATKDYTFFPEKTKLFLSQIPEKMERVKRK